MSTMNIQDRSVGLLDWLMLLLAVVSMVLLSWDTWGHPDRVTRQLLLRADLAICASFALEFCLRVWRSPDRLGFILRNWYEILGMVPASHPALRAFRLIRVVRIIVLLGRFGGAIDRIWGEHTFHQLVQSLRYRLVKSFSGVITVAVLDEVAAVLVKGTYTQNIANALANNEPELRSMLGEKLRADPELRRFSRLPFYGLVVDAAVAASLRIGHEALLDERTDELIADALRENIDQIREAVRLEDAHDHGNVAVGEEQSAA